MSRNVIRAVRCPNCGVGPHKNCRPRSNEEARKCLEARVGRLMEFGPDCDCERCSRKSTSRATTQKKKAARRSGCK